MHFRKHLPFHLYLKRTFADIRQTAFLAMRLRPRRTYVSSMVDKTVAEITALLRRNNLPERHLNLLRFLYIIYKADSVDQTDAMSIRHNSRLSEYISHDQIGALPSHSRQLQKRIKIIRYFSIVFVSQDLHACADVSGLALSQPAGSDNLLDIIDIRVSQCIYIRILLIKTLYYYIYPGVCTLSGQPDADQQLPCLIIVQRTACVRIFLLQSLNHFQSSLFLCHLSSSFPSFYHFLSRIFRISSMASLNLSETAVGFRWS